MRKIFSILWRSILVGLAYLIANMVIGSILAQPGFEFSKTTPQDLSRLLFTTFISGFLMGVTLGPVTTLFRATRVRSTLIFSSVIFLNLVSVLIEGYLFVPGLLQQAFIPSLLLLQFLSSIASSFAITFLFSNQNKMDPIITIDHRSWYSWTWRFIISAASYLLFYFAFGFVNYELVTRPYYETHSSLAVPELSTVIQVASFRSLLLIASILPLITLLHLPRRKMAFTCGMILFVIGGIIPLCMQAGMLPTKLLIASGIEIFFQNFLTGAVAAVALGVCKLSIPDSSTDVFYHLEIEEEAL
ncbi:hypothetical protein OCK74_17330 [Chitinophagaceae bacterium LB-8]|uniref:Uncharacterized protein n=1 Tax=Paraflavisolibacter caeni TaxID=2982496 RepID=A0A9X2XX33_9BACT|nr:hypothetical protein [Paraflavisolibacter caeni]MCU7550886.1 hypothetical protein [Paraflavisolibacter caeni]